MREIRAPLDQLLRKDESWSWGDDQQSAFEKAKAIMVSELLLTHYDPTLPIVVAADASKDGIGATISHIFPDKKEKVIEHASTVLTNAQQNYSQIEKEALALVFAVQKFHRMLFGRKFTLLTAATRTSHRFSEKGKHFGIEGCLLFQNRVIVPQSLRNRMLKSLHMAHPGIVRMKALARQHVYWPGMDSEIERIVRQCEECQKAQKAPIKAPLVPWTPTDKVFQRVHIDFAGPCQDGHVYFILVDSYSKWPEVYLMNSMTAAATEFGIKHTFTPPFHPQSNGQVERFVDTFKRAMMKCKGVKNSLEKVLLSYRSMPNSAIDGYSPDQLFLGRKFWARLWKGSTIRLHTVSTFQHSAELSIGMPTSFGADWTLRTIQIGNPPFRNKWPLSQIKRHRHANTQPSISELHLLLIRIGKRLKPNRRTAFPTRAEAGQTLHAKLKRGCFNLEKGAELNSAKLAMITHISKQYSTADGMPMTRAKAKGTNSVLAISWMTEKKEKEAI
ncbi:hypothetical protein niasHT_003682 [Heterodera trifolii]|uniref:RNA-directed DNA polymerase n=1 Tax=Heterodera trifolii TaxID=157864 RepID=A0ABD2M8Y2_9BILA